MRRLLAVLSVVAVSALLWGCGAAKQAAADRDFSSLSNETISALNDKSIDPIRDKAPFFGNGRITATIAPASCPNDEEKQAINAVRSRLAIFKTKIIGLNDKYSFRDINQMLRSTDAIYFSLARLYRCEITYQQYAEAYEKIKSGAEQDYVAIRAQIERENAKRAADTAAAFGAALQNVGNAIQQQEAIRQANRPRQTICRQVGDSVNCTTY